MFGISGVELFIIALFVMIIFGPDKIPSLARTIGRFVNEFKKVQDDVETMIRKEMNAPEDSESQAAVPEEPVGTPDLTKPAAAQAFGDDADEEEEDEE